MIDLGFHSLIHFTTMFDQLAIKTSPVRNGPNPASNLPPSLFRHSKHSARCLWKISAACVLNASNSAPREPLGAATLGPGAYTRSLHSST